MRAGAGILAAIAAASLACGGAPSGSANALAVARAAGIADVSPGSPYAGPFDGPEGSVYYLGADRRVTFYHPANTTIWLATLGTDGNPTYAWAITPTGTYRFEGGQPVAVPSTPDEVGAWPHMGAVVPAYLLQLERVQQDLASREASDHAMEAWMLRKSHEINMNILRNIGSSDCTAYYDGPTYIGCW